MTDFPALNMRNIVGYGLGDAANNIAFAMGALFLLNYYTDVAGIPAAAAGTMLLAVRIFDAFADVFAGRIVDKTHTRWGRFRPFLLWGCVPLMLMSVATFSMPSWLSVDGKIAYAYVSYAALGLCYSLVNIPYGSLATVMTQQPQERAKLASSRMICSAATFGFLALVLGPRIRGAHDLQSVFTTTTLVLAVVGIALYLGCFSSTREIVKRTVEEPPFGASVRTLGRNRPLMLLCLAVLATLIGWLSINATSVFFARYVLGDANLFIYIVIVNVLVGTLVSAMLAPTVVNALGKKRTFMTGAAIASTFYALLYIVSYGANSIPVMFVLLTLGALGASLSMTVMWALEADTVEYGEWATGLRIEGLTYSVFSFTRKCGQALGGSVLAYLLAASSYVPNAQHQTVDALGAINKAFALAPSIGFAVAFVIISVYPLTDTRHRELMEEIARRKAQLGGLSPESTNLFPPSAVGTAESTG
jgi:glucuronide carrier protein